MQMMSWQTISAVCSVLKFCLFKFKITLGGCTFDVCSCHCVKIFRYFLHQTVKRPSGNEKLFREFFTQNQWYLVTFCEGWDWVVGTREMGNNKKD